jgi:hypothetical protein
MRAATEEICGQFRLPEFLTTLAALGDSMVEAVPEQ